MATRARASGHTLRAADAPIIFGMVAREDRDHDIAAWFGVNQGRIAEVKDGTKFGVVPAAPAGQLPPSGPPGIKGRILRMAIDRVVECLENGNLEEAKNQLLAATRRYDRHEA
jgi:hypothetical protein